MIVRKTASYFSYSLAGMLLGVVTIPFLTRVLSPEEYAYLGIFTSLIFVFLPCISFSSAELVNINKVSLPPVEYIYFRNSFITFSLLLFIFLLALISLITIIFFKQYLSLVVMTLFIALGRIFSGIHSAELVQTQKANLYGSLNLITSFFVLLATLFLLTIFDASWEGRLLAILFMEWFVTIVRIYIFSDIARNFSWHITSSEIKKFIHFGAPLFIALALAWIIYESDKIIVLNLFSMADLGYYTVAYSIGTFIDRFNQSVTNAIIPKLYNALNINTGYKLLQRYNLFYSIFILLFAGIASLFFYYFSGFILGNAYQDTGLLTSIVLFAFAFSGIYRTSGAVINFYKLNILKTRILFYGAAVNLILSIGLIPIAGLLAPAIGTLVAFMMTAVLSYMFSRSELRKRNISD